MYSEDFVWREHIRSPEENFGKDNQSLTRHHIISVEDKLCSKGICAIRNRPPYDFRRSGNHAEEVRLFVLIRF